MRGGRKAGSRGLRGAESRRRVLGRGLLPYFKCLVESSFLLDPRDISLSLEVAAPSPVLARPAVILFPLNLQEIPGSQPKRLVVRESSSQNLNPCNQRSGTGGEGAGWGAG